jgi:pilus assembly protein CpaB
MLFRGLMGREPVATAPIEAPRQDTVAVLVAAKDLAIGEKLNTLSFAWRDWPREGLVGNMITRDQRPSAIEELQGGRARTGMLVGEPILERKIVLQGGGFMSAALPKGMRAISVAVSERTAASGFILPNDRVDVIVTRTIQTNTPQRPVFSDIVVSNVRVLAINQSFGQEDDKVSLTDVETAVLELDPAQATAVSRAEMLGDLSLALRSLAEGGDAGLTDQRPQLSPGFGRSGGPSVVRFGFTN